MTPTTPTTGGYPAGKGRATGPVPESVRTPTPGAEPHQPGEREALDLARAMWEHFDDAPEPVKMLALDLARKALAHLAERRAGDVEVVERVLAEHSGSHVGPGNRVRCLCGTYVPSWSKHLAHQAAQIAALTPTDGWPHEPWCDHYAGPGKCAAPGCPHTPTRGVSAETHTEWGVRIEGRQEVVSAHHDSREKAERGAATWVAQGDGRTAQIVRREVTDWREVRDAD